MDQSHEVKSDARRALPAVDRLVAEVRAAHPELAPWAAAEAARRVLGDARTRIAERGQTPEGGELLRRAAEAARALAAPHPRRVVNATGVVLHTNLGRAPLAPGAAAAVAAAAGYGDLELDLATGRRGDRVRAVAEKLALASGAEAAYAVNNNAAAVLLALNTLALGREVVVSRGELVEIGGSFRVPEIMERAGVGLVEVGSTNRTHPEDYERAIGPQTALLLKVHRSNFEQRGFVAEVGPTELAEIARRHDLPLLEDLGSGTLLEIDGLPADAFAPRRLRMGADLVCFSGDKLLGGPQAGILLGGAACLAGLRANPLARALRLDKLSLAALDWTLDAYLGGRAEREIPVVRQLTEAPVALERRAHGLAERLAELAGNRAQVDVAAQRASVGGGSLPGFELDSWAVTLRCSAGASALAAALRCASVPVISRVRDEMVWLDVRTLLEDDASVVETSLREALASGPR